MYFGAAEITGQTTDDEWMFVKINMIILIMCICESIMALAASLQVGNLLSALPLENTVKTSHLSAVLNIVSLRLRILLI